MLTKEKNVPLNLSIPESLKEEFVLFAYDLGTNPTNLLKMFMKQAITTKEVNFKAKNHFEIEEFSDEEYADLMNDKEIKEGLARLDRVFN